MSFYKSRYVQEALEKTSYIVRLRRIFTIRRIKEIDTILDEEKIDMKNLREFVHSGKQN